MNTHAAERRVRLVIAKAQRVADLEHNHAHGGSKAGITRAQHELAEALDHYLLCHGYNVKRSRENVVVQRWRHYTAEIRALLGSS